VVAAKTRILIVAREQTRLGSLAVGLDALGWRTITARGPYAAMATLADLSIEAAIVDLGEGPDAANLAGRLKAASAPRRLPVIGLAGPGPECEGHDFDLILTAPVEARRLVNRLEALVRLAVAEEEFELRAQSFAEHGRRLEPPVADAGPLRVLAVGEPTRQFLALSNALKAAGAEVVGAFTVFTAFDYLHDRRFEAVVLWAGEDRKDALQVANGMRRNTRLYHIPAVLCLGAGGRLDPAETSEKGVTILAASDSPDEIAFGVVELARAYRRQNIVRAALEKARGSGLMDAATGLFTRDLFASHLIRLAQAAQARNRELSVCVLKVAETASVAAARAGGWLDRAVPQIGSMIGRLVRVEDTPARLGAEVFALAMPGADLEAARVACKRIAAVIACTAFEAGEGRPPFVAEFDIGAAQIHPGGSAGQALEIAAAEASQRWAG
jgi:two-component system cell cycle response regulator PopA